MPVTTLAMAPVQSLPGDEARAPEEGIALCLSGGGYRAMLFHTGAIWRMAELDLLRKLRRVSSVSGGSIAAGVLGLHWKELELDGSDVPGRLREVFVEPIRRLAGRTIDLYAILTGATRIRSSADHVARSYRKYLYGDATLQDLPADHEGPRFVINATSVHTGALWRFSRPYMADHRVGQVDVPTVPLAVAVAASSAFPPFLSPLALKLDPKLVKNISGTDLHREPFTTRVALTDGGVYDNLGLETAWKRYRTVIVSDGGGATGAELAPKWDWARHSYRILNLIDNQVRSLRKRQLIHSYQLPVDHRDHRTGTYWGIRADIANYNLSDSLPAPVERTLALAETPTRLKALPDELQKRLINWGYAVCDAALRTHVLPGAPRPGGWPYPEAEP